MHETAANNGTNVKEYKPDGFVCATNVVPEIFCFDSLLIVLTCRCTPQSKTVSRCEKPIRKVFKDKS
jgi:hypothetical protein